MALESGLSDLGIKRKSLRLCSGGLVVGRYGWDLHLLHRNVCETAHTPIIACLNVRLAVNQTISLSPVIAFKPCRAFCRFSPHEKVAWVYGRWNFSAISIVTICHRFCLKKINVSPKEGEEVWYLYRFDSVNIHYLVLKLLNVINEFSSFIGSFIHSFIHMKPSWFRSVKKINRPVSRNSCYRESTLLKEASGCNGAEETEGEKQLAS